MTTAAIKFFFLCCVIIIQRKFFRDLVLTLAFIIRVFIISPMMDIRVLLFMANAFSRIDNHTMVTAITHTLMRNGYHFLIFMVFS